MFDDAKMTLFERNAFTFFDVKNVIEKDFLGVLQFICGTKEHFSNYRGEVQKILRLLNLSLVSKLFSFFVISYL